MAPTDFKKGQQIEVKAVKMTSIHTQLPYEYYSLPFCLPKNGSNSIHYKSENLGEVCIKLIGSFLSILTQWRTKVNLFRNCNLFVYLSFLGFKRR